MTRVTDALTAVDEDRYTRTADGSLVTQSTAAAAITRELRVLDIPEGARVLELGTGSGFSTALIAELVGPRGHVVTLDVVPDLTTRATAIFREAGIGDRVTALTRDGLQGAPEHGPFDRIVAWATPGYLPKTWIEQSRPGTVIVTPVDIAPLARIARGMVRLTVDADGAPQAERVYSGGYVDMHDEVLSQWLLPTRLVDIHAEHGGSVWWGSSAWLRTAEPEAQRQSLARLRAVDPADAEPDPLTDGETFNDLCAWLFATQPTHLATAGIRDPRPWIGALTSTGLSLVTSGGRVHSGDADADKTLTRWLDDWRAAGAPGWDHMRPVATASQGGWTIRLTTAVPTPE